MLFTTLFTVALATLASAKQWDITVGGAAGLVYTPNHIPHAAKGDVLRFTFQIKNHTLTQSSFGHPCTPLKHGITSGFQPVAPDATHFPYFDVHIKNSKPLFFHCEQTGHCPSGMVFAVNTGNNHGPHSFERFLAKAKALAPSVASSSSSAAPTPTKNSKGWWY